MKNDEVLNIWLSFDTIKISQDTILYISFIRIGKTHIGRNRNSQFNLKCKECKFER